MQEWANPESLPMPNQGGPRPSVAHQTTMPELPEVETVRRSLEPYVIERRIAEVEARETLQGTHGYRVLQSITPFQLAKGLAGMSFRALRRKGKLLVAELTTSQKPEPLFLHIHLGMTGQLTFRDPARQDQPFTRHPKTGLQRSWQHPVDQHTHIVVTFQDQCQLLYRDIRKFGRWSLLDSATSESALHQLGPDPLTQDWTLAGFSTQLERSNRPVKALLLDQSLLAGVGNIYADEALFQARVHPTTPGRCLEESQIAAIYRAVRGVLQLGVDHGGTSLSDYVDADGNPGRNQERLQCYGRYGESCYDCQSTLERMVVAQRTTTFCPKCQGLTR
jgi:formamidopyrimidine-DNA glycosylase